MLRKITYLMLVALIPLISDAQRWKRFRKEYSFGIGASNFLGDLGGANQVGTNGLKDLEIALTRPAAIAAYRYQLTYDLYWKTNLAYLRVNGDDHLTEEPARKIRELKFRSPIWELSTQLEYMIIKEKSGHLYRLRGVRGQSWFKMNVYIFGGIGGILFNPRAQYTDGKWYSLRKLGTEGQGLPDGPPKYSGFTFITRYGIGFKRNLDRLGMKSIGLELTAHNTFSDYIDDVSGNYYNTDIIRQNSGDVAAYFADPGGVYQGPAGHGQQRGDPNNDDAYMSAMLTFNFKIRQRRRNLPKF